MEFSIDQQYRLQRLALSVYGLWPYHNRTTSTRIKRVLTFFFYICVSAAQIIKICMTDLTVDFVLDCLPIFIPTLGGIGQFLMRIIINDKLRDLLDQIKIDWECARSQDEIDIMQANVKYMNKVTKIFLLYGFSGLSIYMLTTFIPQLLDVFRPLNESRPWEHPFHMEFFLNDERHFYFIRFLMYFCIVFAAGMFIANNTIFATYTQHASGMFTILGYRVEQLFNDKQKLSKCRFNCEKDYKNIAIFVEDHRNTLQFVDIIQSCYGINIFFEFFGLLLLLGTTMVQIIKFNQSGMSDRPIRSVAYIGAQIFYMFMYSYVGQQLIDKSTQLSMKIYSSRWHSTVVWKQKMMIFIMLKCMRTITINAYNIFILRLESFSAILQSAMSFCMVLRHM